VTVEIGCRTIRARPYLKALASDAAALMRAVGAPRAELSLSFVTDRAIRRLNRDFRGKDSATDVLSFPQFNPDAVAAAALATAAPAPLGDIVISIETAARQARELNIEIAARLRTLLIHGMLHLLGYDHEASAAEARRMFKREHQLAALLAGDGAAAQTTPASSAWSPAAMPPRRRVRRSTPRVRKRAGATTR
jgi:probable rRNA maturation factor